LANWPGYVVVPEELSPDQYCTWWENVRRQEEDEEDTRPGLVRAFETRKHLVLEAQIEGLDWSLVESGHYPPSMKLLSWFVGELGELIDEASSLPNSPRPSSVTASGNGSEQNAQAETETA
jgi:hypothetical protein